MTDDVLIEVCIDAASCAAAAAAPYLGDGDHCRSQLDAAATAAMGRSLAKSALATTLQLGAAEGTRDGSPTLEVPAASGSPSVAVYADPVDGTTSAVRGGTRSCSVIALSHRALSPWQQRLPDHTSVFSIGSHHEEVGSVLRERGSLRRFIHRQATSRRSIGLLNRVDNLSLLSGSGLGPAIASGDNTHYRPSLAGEAWLAVGDTTVLLPLECDAEVGRMGLVEQQIQSGMYESWTGVIVSRDRLQDYPGGSLRYLEGYLARAAVDPVAAVGEFFSAGEVAHLRSSGVELADVPTILDQQTFGIGPDAVLAIAGLDTNAEPGLRPPPVTLYGPWPIGATTMSIHVLAGHARRPAHHLVHRHFPDQRQESHVAVH